MLVFISNELLSPTLQRELGVPLEFVSFAITKGQMYSHYAKRSTFVLRGGKVWGNSVVYGVLFHLRDSDFYLRLLDSYHACSMSSLYKNHVLDLHHRLYDFVTPISFNNVDELERLMYKEREEVKAMFYVGNPKHNNITRRLHRRNSYRVLDGIMPQQYNEIYKEVSQDETI